MIHSLPLPLLIYYWILWITSTSVLTSRGTPTIRYIYCFFHWTQCHHSRRLFHQNDVHQYTDFTTYLLHHNITLDTDSGYSFFLNRKGECPHQSISQLVWAMLLNSGHPSDTLSYCAETAANIYWYTSHSALGTSPYEAWYNINPTIADLRCLL